MKSKFVPGLRIIKTCLSVLLCLLISYAIQYDKPIYALLSCVLMMKSTPEDSVQAGKERIIGTFIGGIIAEIFLSLVHLTRTNSGSFFYLLLIPLAIFTSLMICKILKLPSYAASMSCVLIIIMMMQYTDTLSDSFLYVGMRMVETLGGIVIALVVNLYLKVPDFIKDRLKGR